MKIQKVLFVLAIIIFSVVFCTKVEAASGTISDIFNQGNEFANRGNGSTTLGNKLKEVIYNDVLPIVSLIGNLIFAIVTVVLGAKYIWSGVDGKSRVKETLPGFVAAIVFFYLAIEITSLFDPNISNSIGGEISNVNSYDTAAAKIVGTINSVVKYLSFAGIAFVGIKYMFESSNGKADVKERLFPMVIGMALVYCASYFVDFIISVGKQALR